MAFPRPGRVRLPTEVRRGTALLAFWVAIALWSGCGGGSSTYATATPAPGSPTVSHAPAPANASAAPQGRPNIVFVLTDDLASNLLPYMPHVLAMQSDGVTFANYFVTDSLCCPSRASIFSGRFPHNTHVFSNGGPDGGFHLFHERGEEGDTFATAIQRAGYETALMGKYLNGYLPAATEGGTKPYVPPGWSEWDVAGNGYPEYGYRLNSNGHVRSYGYEAKDYLTDVLAGKGVEFIDRAAERRKPFLLEIATFAPHSPFTPAPRDAAAFPGLKEPRTPAFDAVGTNEPAWLSQLKTLLPRQIVAIDHEFRLRAQAVQAVDRMIARIEAELVAKGLADNTYVVFSSDNGLHMGEHHLLPGKLTAFDTDIKVPLIVTGPGVPAGRTVTQLAENVDLRPSFQELARVPVPADVDGHSLVALLHGQTVSDWRQEALVEHHGRVLAAGDPDLPTRGSGNPPDYEALRTPQSVYVEYRDGEREYYDLRRDPFELTNIAPELPPAQLELMHRTLVAIEGCHGAAACWRAQHAGS